MKQSTSGAPAHVAMIMDGNGRWAEQRGLPRSQGHRAGASAMRTVVEHCGAVGVAQLTLYAFSSDNWRRPTREVQALLALFTLHFRSEASALARANVRVTVIGRRDRLPIALRAAIRAAEAHTAHCRGMELRVALDYSSRTAILRAQAPLHTDTPADTHTILPPVDLLVRTGGERRLSDFLLWECAYAELLFLDVLWPDISPAVLDAAFADFAARDRRFGGASQRVSA